MYKYLMLHRGASIGTVPQDGLVEICADYGMFGYVVYNRKLTTEELNEYEMRELSDEEITSGKMVYYSRKIEFNKEEIILHPVQKEFLEKMPLKMYKDGNIRTFYSVNPSELEELENKARKTKNKKIVVL